MTVVEGFELSQIAVEREPLTNRSEYYDHQAAPSRSWEDDHSSQAYAHARSALLGKVTILFRNTLLRTYEAFEVLASLSRRAKGPRWLHQRGFCRRLGWLHFTAMLCALAVIVYISFTLSSSSYAARPAHYHLLRRQAQGSAAPGRCNPQNEKVFIAATLWDPEGHIVSGAWGDSIERLVDLLGPHNTFVSIYESDSGSQGTLALQQLQKNLKCKHSIISEETLSWNDTARIRLLDGELAIKRIAYLAATRNRALDPLDMHGKYDKILYLNDVIFDPVEAAQLLFSTNLQYDGRSKYKAACAMDFIDPFKFYDTFATRDSEGYSMGLPLYPWFSKAGRGQSRQDVLDIKDAVRVRACWGGMVAFNAKFFQVQNRTTFGPESRVPVRFRAEPELDWESSECCLIHSDLQANYAAHDLTDYDTEIYVNPYVRTAYSQRTFRLLGAVRRIERLFLPIQSMANMLAGLPFYNERRMIAFGQPITKTVWIPNTTDGGRWERQTLPANFGGFCALKDTVMVRRLKPVKGRKNWEEVPLSSIASEIH